ncbi:MAG TPA: hypothetical protein VI953_04835 [Candidatus Paceibacterota bacterium]
MDLKDITGILGVSSLVLALYEYGRKAQRDTAASIADQVSFFRKEVLGLQRSLEAKIREKNPTYICIQVPIHKPGIFSSSDTRGINGQGSILSNPDIADSFVEALNALEDAAVKIYLYNTESSPLLNPIRGAFIQLVERCAVALIRTRDISPKPSVYQNTLDLYWLWQADQ